MPLPSSYTEETLATFMHTTLGASTTAALNLTAPDSYEEAVYEVMLTLGVSDLAAATDLRKMRRLARREALRVAVAGAAGLVTHAGGDDSISLSDLTEHLQAQLTAAELAAVNDDDEFQPQFATVIDRGDPYLYLPDDQRGASQ